LEKRVQMFLFSSKSRYHGGLLSVCLSLWAEELSVPAVVACMQRISFLNKKFVEYYMDIGIYRKTNCFTTHVGTRITQNALTRYYADDCKQTILSHLEQEWQR